MERWKGKQKLSPVRQDTWKIVDILINVFVLIQNQIQTSTSQLANKKVQQE